MSQDQKPPGLDQEAIPTIPPEMIMRATILASALSSYSSVPGETGQIDKLLAICSNIAELNFQFKQQLKELLNETNKT